jgi:hypothetical protein
MNRLHHGVLVRGRRPALAASEPDPVTRDAPSLLYCESLARWRLHPAENGEQVHLHSLPRLPPLARNGSSALPDDEVAAVPTDLLSDTLEDVGTPAISRTSLIVENDAPRESAPRP